MGLSAGTMRNLTPAQIPTAVEAAGEPFTVVVELTHGKLIATAQVVADDTHDPRYVVGFAQ
jgi:hypothetical protein